MTSIPSAVAQGTPEHSLTASLFHAGLAVIHHKNLREMWSLQNNLKG